MIKILWFVIGAVVGMIITALVSADETIQRRDGRIKYINYDAAMQEIRSYWIACKKDWKDDNIRQLKKVPRQIQFVKVLK